MPGQLPTVTYAFAVCRRCDPGALVGLPGLDDATPVRTLAAGPLTAVVQDLSAVDFAEDALRQRLTDRDELERCARAHHEVIMAASAVTPTVPLPFATLYLGDARARAALREKEESFLAALGRFTGRVEWGVKVYTAPAPPASSPAPSPTPGAAAGGGRAYLDRVRSRHQGREQRQNEALQAAERVDAVVRGLAVAARRLRPHGVEVTGAHRTHVLNAAYLINSARESELRAALEALRGEETAVQIELSGPWAPYSFADGSDGGGGGGGSDGGVSR
ncbi:GvpL/GvpF family gas vesicle protein [Streptomyces sp. NBS 14/10]|uniref:GvpL/GvpF family gas vesicle protein n=1 Tax=Streptomyces sp. NBS 14/10 TaxID=1945643 RepID=UPI000B7FA997|nr:GvpL/GvpF family gas vesicle protein [Streptomyces sp. NBS 14/10]KAK1186210.1 GvpL/GvpF family gas vesicle protein [Streptomyces sp. NBS 14/10]